MLLIVMDSTDNPLAILNGEEIPNQESVGFIEELTKAVNIKAKEEIDSDWIRSMWDSRQEQCGNIILQAECMCGRE